MEPSPVSYSQLPAEETQKVKSPEKEAKTLHYSPFFPKSQKPPGSPNPSSK